MYARLHEVDDHDEEDQEVNVLEEVEHMLGVVVDEDRDGLDGAGLQHEEGVQRDEAEHRQLTEERREHS